MSRWDEMADKMPGDSHVRVSRAQIEEAAHYDRQYKHPRSYEDEPSDARISAQLAFMQKNLDEMSGMLNALQNRLEPILMPEIDGPENTVASPPRKLASVLSNTIDDLNVQIGHYQRRIASMIDRVQL